MSKKDAAIYRKAVRGLTQERYSCRAIQWAATGDGNGCIVRPHDTTSQYNAMFRPSHVKDEAWGHLWGVDATECRVLALLFAAAMAESGDL